MLISVGFLPRLTYQSVRVGSSTKRITETQKVGVILHQWFHAWGGKKILRAKEKLCRNADDLSANALVKEADQYMQFIYFVGSKGTVLSCF